MRPLAALSVLALCTSICAAPAPFFRAPRGGDPWAAGWDAPVNPGGCRFERNGGRLLIAQDKADPVAARLRSDFAPPVPRLMRNVGGDFVAQVKITLAKLPADGTRYRAGLILVSGDDSVRTMVAVDRSERGIHNWIETFIINNAKQTREGIDRESLKAPAKGVWLRIERRGQDVRLLSSANGTTWNNDFSKKDYFPVQLQVKIGVYVHELFGATCEAVFDQFKLTAVRD